MLKEDFWKFLLVLLAVDIVGVLIMLLMMGGSDYYQNQEYNSLKPLEETPIEHYEEARDESVKATEEHIAGVDEEVVAPEPVDITFGNNTDGGVHLVTDKDGKIIFPLAAVFAVIMLFVQKGRFFPYRIEEGVMIVVYFSAIALAVNSGINDVIAIMMVGVIPILLRSSRW